MTEYWINVYKWDHHRCPDLFKQEFFVYHKKIDALNNMASNSILYRIHVKLKDKKEIAVHKMIKAMEFQPQDIYEKYMHGGY